MLHNSLKDLTTRSQPRFITIGKNSQSDSIVANSDPHPPGTPSGSSIFLSGLWPHFLKFLSVITSHVPVTENFCFL